MASHVAAAPPETEFVTFGPVHLDVVNRNRSLTWWRDVVGLEVVQESNAESGLGVDGRSLVVLRPTASAPVRRDFSGLFHLAINLPDETAFAQLLARLLESGARLAATTT